MTNSRLSLQAGHALAAGARIRLKTSLLVPDLHSEELALTPSIATMAALLREIGAQAGFNMFAADGELIDFLDVRLHAAVTLYPKPIGFQAEYNIGKGPELDGKIVKDSFLNGGYAMLFARVPTSFGTFVPYVRGQYYHGGRKTETNAPLTIVKEVEAGVEWQVWKPFELTMAFTASDRETNRKGLTGEFLRLQAQINY